MDFFQREVIAAFKALLSIFFYEFLLLNLRLIVLSVGIDAIDLANRRSMLMNLSYSSE